MHRSTARTRTGKPKTRSSRRPGTAMAAATMALSLVAAACSSTSSGVTSHPASSSLTTSHAAVPGRSGLWLAIADSSGVVIWSRAGGTSRVSGSPSAAVVYGDLTWSANGRYLAWYEQPVRGLLWNYRPIRNAAGPDCGSGKLVVFDTAKDEMTTWNVADLFEPMVVTAEGVYVFENGGSCGYGLVHYLPDGRRVSVPVTGASRTGRISAWADAAGFVAVDGATRPTVFSLALDGSATLLAQLPAATTGTDERFVASPDGSELAIEQGAQTQGNGSQRCASQELASGSALVTVDLLTGTARRFELPPGPSGMTDQIGTMSYGPANTLDLSEYVCGAAQPPGAALKAPLLLQLHAGALEQVAWGVIAGERSVTGFLAVMPGRYELIRGPMPGAEVATTPWGPAVEVDGAAVPGLRGTASDISWSPNF